MSLYFKEHRQYYYELLNSIRITGDWEAWLLFFAESVTAAASQGVEVITKLANMTEADKANIAALGRTALLERPIVTANWLVEKTGLTAATMNKTLENLERIRIVKRLNDAKRDRLFVYGQYMDILNA